MHLRKRYEETEESVKAMIRKIKEEHGNVIDFEIGEIPIEKRITLCFVSDMVLITILKQGFCILPFEYMAVKHISKQSPGSIILSEFAGCNRAILSPVRANPYNVITKQIQDSKWCLKVEELGNTIKKGLEEKREFLENDISYITKHCTYNWAVSFLQDLKRFEYFQVSDFFL